jgi:hypothetical protein
LKIILKNKKQISNYQEKYRKNHKVNMEKYNKNYNKKYKKEIISKQKNYYKNNKKRVNEYNRKYKKYRKSKDPIYKISYYLRSRIWHVLKGKQKSQSTIKLLGCSIEQLKKHLEKKFTKGMSFSNYGKWHIDHIRPCVRFDLSKPSEQAKCFNYTNLQPLWAKENLSKGEKNDYSN